MILNLLNIMLAVVVGPLMEELVFRGLLLQRLMVKMSVNRALIISSILFGVLHFESWLSAAIFGLMMGLLFLKTSNLWVPIIVHIFNNLVVVSLNLWQYRQGQVWTLEEAHIFLPIYLVAFMILPVIIIFIRKYWPQDHMQLPYLLNQSHQ
ncbi:MAG: CPBP family intramembrane metalloprotease [Saprospiraceae bacterium]|nr:CPBP family intramembrane metalloprotease [Saprospiraceae bacterium]